VGGSLIAQDKKKNGGGRKRGTKNPSEKKPQVAKKRGVKKEGERGNPVGKSPTLNLGWQECLKVV